MVIMKYTEITTKIHAFNIFTNKSTKEESRFGSGPISVYKSKRDSSLFELLPHDKLYDM